MLNDEICFYNVFGRRTKTLVFITGSFFQFVIQVNFNASDKNKHSRQKSQGVLKQFLFNQMNSYITKYHSYTYNSFSLKTLFVGN